MCECVVGGLSVSAVNNFVFFFLFTGFLLCSFWLKRFIYFEFNMFLYLVAQDILTFEFLCVAVSHFFSTRNKRYSSTRFDFLSAVYMC